MQHKLVRKIPGLKFKNGRKGNGKYSKQQTADREQRVARAKDKTKEARGLAEAAFSAPL
jgi:hypothetical protein